MEAARVATAHDIGRIAELARAMRAELVAMRGGALWADRDARAEPLEDSYGALLARDDARLVAGTVDQVIVGFGAVELERLRSGALLGVVTDIFVEPGARAVGVGEAMTNDLVAFCDEHACVGVDALALPGHRATKNFFEESGFTARALVMHRAGGGGSVS